MHGLECFAARLGSRSFGASVRMSELGRETKTLQLVPLPLKVGRKVLVLVRLVVVGRLLDLVGSHAVTVPVAVEEHALVLALGALVGLDPLAPAGSLVQGADEAPAAVLDVGAVVLAHDGLDGLGGLVGVVEGDGGDVVVEDVGLDDAVEDLAADETELAVNGGGGTTGKVPGLAGCSEGGKGRCAGGR
jgi:hypothetical protein